MTQSEDVTRMPSYALHLRQATDNAMAKAEQVKAAMGQGGKYKETRPAAFMKGHWIWAHPFTMQVFDLVRVEREQVTYWEARAGSSGNVCYAASTLGGLLYILNKNAALTWVDQQAQELHGADQDEAVQIELDGTQMPEPAHEQEPGAEAAALLVVGAIVLLVGPFDVPSPAVPFLALE